MSKFAIIEDGTVINIVVAAAADDVSLEAGREIVAVSTGAEIGGTYADSVFTPIPTPDPPAPSTDPTDYPLNPFQFFTFLERIGLSEATVDAAIDSVEPDAMKRIEHKRRFRHAQTYNRDNTLLVSLVSAVGKTTEEIDTAWMQAKDLK